MVRIISSAKSLIDAMLSEMFFTGSEVTRAE